MKISKLTLSIISLLIPAAIFAAEPSGYYQSCEGSSGKALLEKVANVVTNHTTVSYDGLWEVYKTSDTDSDGKLWDMYSTKRWSYPGSKCGSYSNEGDCYNREHSFPKSWFNNASPMVSDAFHVYPTDGKVNGMRSNFPYGETNGEKWKPSGVGLGKLGSCTYPGYTGTVFEPDDEYKGDFARSYFYMAAAYNSRIANWDSPMLNGTSYPAFADWSCEMLLKWHRQDPVSQKEIDRNDAVYAFQKNRNPFIDHPDLVEHIWGNAKTSAWYIGGVPTPTLAIPSADETLDFGLVAVNYQTSRYLTIKGSHFTSPITLAVDNSDFRLSTTTIPAANINAGSGVSISFRGSRTAAYSATLTLTSDGAVISRVHLKAQTINGIPASTIYITETSFTAGWSDLADQETYTLDVRRDGSSIAGFPKKVQAELGEYEVTDLDPLTTYTWSIYSDQYKSEVQTVTTLPLTPSIRYESNPEIDMISTPGEPTQVYEMWIETENIDSPITATVEAPFQLSVNHIDWSTTITLDPQEDRYYVRALSQAEGEFEDFIVLTCGSYINDEAHVTLWVRDNSQPWFVEDFENADKQTVNIGSYNMGSFNGRVVNWTVNDAGIWKADPDKNGDYSLRLGKTSASCISTVEPKTGGIGTVSFYLTRWSNSDGDVTIAVEYSPDGENWTSAGTATSSTDGLRPYEITVNVPGSNYLRLRQTAGKRGNIDDIVVSDYTISAVETIAGDTAAAWDAYAVDSRLVIKSDNSDIDFILFDLTGIILYEGRVSGAKEFDLTSGLYIVSDGSTTRRVVVKG